MGENFNPEELVCGGCSDIAKAQACTIGKYLNFIAHLLNLLDVSEARDGLP
jgi:hypothetical protein